MERPDGRLPSPDHDLVSQFFGGTEAKFGGANSSSIELGVKTRKVVFWSILEHMGQGAWRDLAHGSSSTGYAKEEGRSHLEDQLDHSTNRSSSSTRPAKLQLDRAGSQSQTRKMLLPP
ncbi:unnamed protein product [Microthlaspi erraticum]|uniref:Uncharacterized protein n=1 Tax=Microthlaspi erraticum TaxID=1685480 RepID=A0A6D2JJ15_9BRAS|nr:unnamed protein product [Microthlaspi erraticum]